MKGKIIGFLIFLVIIGGALYFYQFGSSSGGDVLSNTVVIKGFIGGEKKGFLDNPKIKDILKTKYNLIIDYSKAGSIEMVQEDTPSADFLWPSSQVALEIFKNNQQERLVKSEIVFNSPIVLYSWDIITEALIEIGIVKKVKNAYFIVDFPGLIDLVITEKTWKDIGVDELYGRISIISTDPSKSNSGNMFSGLLANILNGDVVDDSSIGKILPKITNFFNRLGYLEHSSGDLFEQYLRTGVGAKPIIVGYESQAVEYSLQHQEIWDAIKNKITILYPEPTVWSSHPVIILNSRASKLIEALKDPEIQRLAWEEHGFRTGLIGVENDPKVLKIAGIPERIDKVMPMPKPEIMEKIISAVKGE